MTQRHFTGAADDDVADNAHLQHIKLAFENAQSYHFAHNDMRWARCLGVQHSFLLGGAVLRHNTSTQLNGENTTLRINSLAMPVKSKSATAAPGSIITKATATAASCINHRQR
jgi:Fe-S cluster assembly protein SufD